MPGHERILAQPGPECASGCASGGRLRQEDAPDGIADDPTELLGYLDLLYYTPYNIRRMDTVTIVWQVFLFLLNDYVLASYDEQACIHFAREQNAGLSVPAFQVERCHIVGGRAV